MFFDLRVEGKVLTTKDISQVLRDVAKELDAGYISGPIRDNEGTRIGQYSIVREA